MLIQGYQFVKALKETVGFICPIQPKLSQKIPNMIFDNNFSSRLASVWSWS